MNLSFGISAPENLSVQNSISTMTKEEQSKQAIALMATGMYLAGSSGAGNLDLNSALTSLLQSQINKTAGKLLLGHRRDAILHGEVLRSGDSEAEVHLADVVLDEDADVEVHTLGVL